MNQNASIRNAPLQSVDVGGLPVRPRSYLAYALGLALLTCASGLLLALTSHAPPIGPTLALAALMIVSENRDRIFGDETSISSSIVIAIGSVVAFHETAPLLGPLICATCAGFYIPHIRNRAVAKSIINACVIGLSGLIAALTFDLASPSGETDGFAIVALGMLAVVAYWITNSTLLAVALALLRGVPLGATTAELIRSETQLVPFAVAGAGAGLVFLREGPWLGVATMVALLVLVEVVWLSPPRRVSGNSRFAAFMTLRATWVFGAGMLAYAVTDGWLSLVVASLICAVQVMGSMTLVLVALRRRLGTWEVGLAFGAALADVGLIATFAIGGAVAGAVEAWIGGLFIVAGSAAVIGCRAFRRGRGRSIDQTTDDDLLVTAAVELAMLDAAEGASPLR
jgi:hypothetical protein